MARFAGQRGETLVEVLIAIVLIGAISSAYFLTASTQTRASSLNKELVQADAVARSYAELAKAEVRIVRRGFDGNARRLDLPGELLDWTPRIFACPASGDNPVTIDLTVTTPAMNAAHLGFAVLAP